MVDKLYSGTRTAEILIAGMSGGAIVAMIPSDGFFTLKRFGLIMMLAFAAMVLNLLNHAWYEYRTGEPFRS